MYKDRIILHSDLNAFYASVECRLRPELRHQPVAVCGDSDARHGIVLAKNEIAKRYGVKTGQVIWQARQLCPNLVTVRAEFGRYLDFSRAVKKIYLRYTDLVESFGIDECWLDVTRAGASGKIIADEIRETIQKELGITASIGVSWNKIFAKLGSDIKKPDATTVISRQNYQETIFGLPASHLLMVGNATKAKLDKYGIFTIGQLAATDLGFLRARLGKFGSYLWTYANGMDTSPVAENGYKALEKSVSNSTTTPRDLVLLQDVRTVVTVLSESVAARLRESGIKGSVIHLGVRDGDLSWWGKQTTLKSPTFVSAEIISVAMNLFSSYNFNAPIRSLGVSVSGIVSAAAPIQTDMFSSENRRIKREKLDFATDKIRGKFGHYSISRALTNADKPLSTFDPKTENVIHPISFM